MKQPENHPWQAANDYAFQRRHGPGGDRWRRIKDDSMLAAYEAAIGTKSITVCPCGVRTVTNWDVIEDPRYDHLTGKINPVIDEDA